MYAEKLIIDNFKNFLENKQIKQKKIILSQFIESIKFFKNQYKKIFEKISEGIIIVDDNYLIKDVLNDHFCNWINLKKEDCIGNSVFKFFNKVFDLEESEYTNLYLKIGTELVPVNIRIIKENIENRIFYKLIILNQKDIIQKNHQLDKIISLYKTLYIINDLILRATDLRELFDANPNKCFKCKNDNL
jgi:sensor histidine kinase regulating citrate/malate metabolism